MEANHPDFKLAWAKSIFYNFCRVHEDGLYDFILFQKVGQTGILTIDIATTYNPFWKGEVTWRLAKAKGLAFVKYGTNSLKAEPIWYVHRNLKEELSIALAEISGDLRLHAMNFSDRSAQELRSNKLIRYGLSLVAQREALDEAQRSQLLADWHAAPRHTENPLYQNLEEALRQFAVNNGHSTDDVRRYVGELLFNFTRQGFSWKDYRI